MSAKYQRIKQADEALPTPLRWLTRAFSSITLAVVLLSLVIVYGVIASVPIALLAKGGLCSLVVVGQGGVALLAGVLLARRSLGLSAGSRRWAGCIVAIGIAITGIGLSVIGARVVNHWATAHPWFRLHRATVIYRLSSLEMTELEFYSWWPLKLVLGLFVLNMVWATIRRIEFRFVNVGVLTVHTGIVVMAIGSIFYGTFKLEGDTLLWRSDLGGGEVSYFYDQTDPALFFLDRHFIQEHGLPPKRPPMLMLGLHELPRYNDRDPNTGRWKISFDDTPAIQQVFGDRVKVTIPGFISYGRLQPTWVDAGVAEDGPHAAGAINPAIRLDDGHDHEGGIVLPAKVPGRRVIDEGAWALQFLVSPDPQRLANLMAEFEGEHGLVVEVPAAGFRKVYTIDEGVAIDAAGTGYRLTVEAIGPYGMSFATRGYEGARDTRAMVRVERGGQVFRRIAMFRYPERSQDFVPAPGDPNVGPMGRRRDPDPAIRLTYIDASRLQYHLITEDPAGDKLKLLARAPGVAPVYADFNEPGIPIPDPQEGMRWLRILEYMTNAVQVQVPVITPKPQRQPKDEGTYIHALLPVDLEVVSAEGRDHPVWRRRVWLPHMRYPEYPDGVHAPVRVDLPPESGMTEPVYLAFSRVRRPLPFSLMLDAFEMQAYEGSTIPRDYVADLSITALGPDGRPSGRTQHGQARLNNPLIHSGMKLSQTGWDPGDRKDPNHQARNDKGRFINQQRYSIIGVGNNVGIRAIFVGACLVVVGIPWAFYIKPLLVRRQSRRLRQAAESDAPASARSAA